MDQSLLTIGVFARAVGLTPSALRFYDECGLLRPAEIDEATGYRYYTPALARRAEMVARMRDAGLPIEVMRTALEATGENRRQVLRAVLAEQKALAARRTSLLESLIADTPATGDAHTVTVSGPELSAAIRQVRVAADADPSSQLSGVLLDFTAGAVDVVATNRYWMAIRTVSTSAITETRMVVPPGDITQLCSLLDEHDHADIKFNKDSLSVAGEEFLIPDVAYPAHRVLMAGLLPVTTRIALPRTELIALIDTVGHATFDLSVTAYGIRIGDSDLASTVTTPGASLRMGSALARRALECAIGPEVVLGLASETQAVRVTSPYQSGFLALLMPIARSEP